jgi:hypothetical protein
MQGSTTLLPSTTLKNDNQLDSQGITQKKHLFDKKSSNNPVLHNESSKQLISAAHMKRKSSYMDSSASCSLNHPLMV